MKPLSEKMIDVMKIESLLWLEPYGSTKMLEENPFSKEKFIYQKDVKEAVKKLKEEIGDHLGMGYRYRLTCKIIDKIFGEELSK